VTAKNGSNVQQCLEEAVNSMNISKLKKVQVILANKHKHTVFLNNINLREDKFSIFSTNRKREKLHTR
jgi:hypothetical protein